MIEWVAFWPADRCLCYTSPATPIHSELVSFLLMMITNILLHVQNNAVLVITASQIWVAVFSFLFWLGVETDVLQWMAVAHRNKSCLLGQSHSRTLIFTHLPVIYLSVENCAPCVQWYLSHYFVHWSLFLAHWLYGWISTEAQIVKWQIWSCTFDGFLWPGNSSFLLWCQ